MKYVASELLTSYDVSQVSESCQRMGYQCRAIEGVRDDFQRKPF